MKSIVLNIPESDSLATLDIAVYIAAKMYEDGIMTAGQAALVAGLTKRTFIEIMGKYGVSVFSRDVNDLYHDYANA